MKTELYFMQHLLLMVLITATPLTLDAALTVSNARFREFFKQNSRACEQAIKSNNLQLVEELIARNKLPINGPLICRKNAKTPLGVAARSNHPAMCLLLMRHGADPNLAGRAGITPLMKAAAHGSLEACAVLLQHGADHTIGFNGAQPLNIAAFAGRTDVVKLLLQHGADPNAGHNTIKPLYLAALHGHVEMCDALIRHGADLYNESSIIAAISKNRAPICRLFLQKGIDPNKPLANGATLLFEAVEYGCIETCEVLLEYGASPNQLCSKGISPLHIAVCMAYINVCRLLLASGADSNMICLGQTALDVAREEKRSITLKKKRTALERTLEQKYTEIIALLTQ